MVFKRITPAETFFVYLILNDSGMRVALVLFCEPYDQGQVRNMSAQPDQILRIRTTIFRLSYNSLVQRYFGGKVNEKRYRLSRAYN